MNGANRVQCVIPAEKPREIQIGSLVLAGDTPDEMTHCMVTRTGFELSDRMITNLQTGQSFKFNNFVHVRLLPANAIVTLSTNEYPE
jgi:hypothetical protein